MSIRPEKPETYLFQFFDHGTLWAIEVEASDFAEAQRVYKTWGVREKRRRIVARLGAEDADLIENFMSWVRRLPIGRAAGVAER